MDQSYLPLIWLFSAMIVYPLIFSLKRQHILVIITELVTINTTMRVEMTAIEVLPRRLSKRAALGKLLLTF